MAVKIYHNPKCSKSRETLSILKEKEVEIEEVLYLENTPDFDELKKIISLLSCEPKDILRTSEARDAGIEGLNGDDLIHAMVKNPITIQRPIAVNGDKAIIGRPPENVISIL